MDGRSTDAPCRTAGRNKSGQVGGHNQPGRPATSAEPLFGLLREYGARYRRLLTFVALLQLAATLASLYLPTVDAAIIDNGVAKGDTAVIARLAVVMLAVSGAQVLCSVGASRLASCTGMGVGRDLRSTIFRKVTSFSAHEVEKFGAPSLLARSTSDVQLVQQLVQMGCTTLITAAITGIGGIFMALHEDPGLSRVLLVAMPVLGVANYWIMSHMMPRFRAVQKLFDTLSGLLHQQLSGIRVIRAFARERLAQQRFAEVNAALSNAVVAAERWQNLLQPVSMLVLNVSSIALLWFGGLRIDAGQMQVGSLIAFVSYAMQILSAVMMASLMLGQLPRASVSAERISEILAATPAIAEPQYPVHRSVGEGVIRIDKAAFCFPGADRPVLQDISFTATPGTVTAIVGSTGSGKSTLISLLCRLYDVTAGSVSLDGVDIRDYDTERLWSRIGLVPQRGYLFSGTVAENLRYGKADATDAEMWEALRVAAADGFVAAHPEGLRMPVAQGGIDLSGGQRQRLAIARAVIRRPALYLFDDALSALDMHTQADVWAALRDISAGSTVIVVSQRISIAAAADQVIVIDDGAVVGNGTHESLLADCPVYAEFAGSQAMAVVGLSR